MFRERERLKAHHVANDAFNFLEVSEDDMQQEKYVNIENSLEICLKFEAATKLVTIMIREDYKNDANLEMYPKPWVRTIFLKVAYHDEVKLLKFV